MKFLLLAVLFLISCSHPENKENGGLERRRLDSYFQSTGTTRYFLTDLPNWANFSTSGKCFRTPTIRFLDLQKLRESFSLSYEQAVQFQILFNKLYLDRKEETNTDYLLFWICLLSPKFSQCRYI